MTVRRFSASRSPNASRFFLKRSSTECNAFSVPGDWRPSSGDPTHPKAYVTVLDSLGPCQAREYKKYFQCLMFVHSTCKVLNMRLVPFLTLMFLSLYSSVLRAQSTNGSIAGRVTDPSKAVVADAKVAAINTGTNVRYESATNVSGDYYLTNLPPGELSCRNRKDQLPQKLIKPSVILSRPGCSRNRLRDDGRLRVTDYYRGGRSAGGQIPGRRRSAR